MKAYNKKEWLCLALSEMLCAVLMTACAYPAMLRTGKFGLQILLTVGCSLAAAVIFDFLKIKDRIIAHSVCFSLAFWALAALVGQMTLKGTFFIFATPWKYMFYYDSIGSVLLSVIVMTAYRRLRAYFKKDKLISAEYEKFYRTVSVAFVLFFILVLIYCFFLCRTPDVQRPIPHLTPFSVFKWTFLSGELDYERLVLFFGNIAIFVPIGFLMYKKNSGKLFTAFLVTFPILLSSAIELSQYYFKMGDPDIDDVILNVLGFYIGALLKLGFDKLFPLKKED